MHPIAYLLCKSKMNKMNISYVNLSEQREIKNSNSYITIKLQNFNMYEYFKICFKITKMSEQNKTE